MIGKNQRFKAHFPSFVDYTGCRKLERFASQLCITPHYLTEISKKTSGRPATYWIELFLIRAATIALMQIDRPLEEIADALSFSSLSHFSRFIKSKFDMTPTQFRNQLSRAQSQTPTGFFACSAVDYRRQNGRSGSAENIWRSLFYNLPKQLLNYDFWCLRYSVGDIP